MTLRIHPQATCLSSFYRILLGSYPLAIIAANIVLDGFSLGFVVNLLKDFHSFVPASLVVWPFQSILQPIESEFCSHNLQLQQPSMNHTSIPIKRPWLLPNNRGNIQDFYQVESEEMASGQFGTVFRGRLKVYTSSLWRAVKRIPKEAVTDKAQLLIQLDIMSRLDHPNISRLFETFQDDRYIYLISQLCEGGQLFDRILEEGSFMEQEAREYFLQVMSAVSYLHSQEVAHRDIKPQNLLFLSKDKNSPLKLIDFGLSTRFSKAKPNSMKDTVGTAFYMAPEVIKGVYDQRCDVWSVGVILYLMVAGCQPFNAETDEEVEQLVRKMDYSFDIPQIDHITDNLRKLLSSLLTDATKRLSADVALRHPWAASYELRAPTLEMDSLNAFAGYGKLKRLSVAIIASQANHTDLQNASFNFKLANYSHTGILYNDELKTALQRQPSKPSQAQIYEIVASLDPTGQGKINFNEFAAANTSFALTNHPQMIGLSFQILDLDQDKKISRQDLSNFLSKSQCKFEGSYVDQLIQEGDNNKDGVIDQAEYLTMIIGNPQS